MSASEKAPAWLRFTPLYMQRVWGGDALARIYSRQIPEELLPVGESWELTDRPEAESVVRGGPWHGRGLHQLWRQQRATVFGSASLRHPSARFPLLLKILDAREVLSLQVHPPAAAAAELGGEQKDEFWYIAEAGPDSAIFAGLRPGVDEARMREALQEGRAAELVQRLKPGPGQCLSLPSGRVHALGAGLLVFEVQQNSDTTYRVFDWNRRGLDGNPRHLHIEPSLRCIDFNDCSPQLFTPRPGTSLTDSQHFDIRLGVDPESIRGPGDGAVLIAVTRGTVHARLDDAAVRASPGHERDLTLNPGDFCLLPASGASTRWTAGDPSARWLEVRLRI